MVELLYTGDWSYARLKVLPDPVFYTIAMCSREVLRTKVQKQ